MGSPSGAQAEGEEIARRLFALRLEARDTMLASLVAAREIVCGAGSVIADCVDRALDTQGLLERTFWLDSLGDVIRSREQAQHEPLFAVVVCRIEVIFVVTPCERHDAVRLLADRLVVVA